MPSISGDRDDFKELFDDCESDMRNFTCHSKQHILAKLVHKMCAFRDEDTEWSTAIGSSEISIRLDFWRSIWKPLEPPGLFSIQM